MKSPYLTFCLIMMVFAPVMVFTEISINRSASLPYRLFLVVKGVPVKKGDLVSIRGHRVSYFKETNFTKYVAGVEGDATAHLKTDLKPLTKNKKPLNPLAANFIPKGAVFVRADHKDSFDSRYEEFGLVRTTSIVGRAFPLW